MLNPGNDTYKTYVFLNYITLQKQVKKNVTHIRLYYYLPSDVIRIRQISAGVPMNAPHIPAVTAILILVKKLGDSFLRFVYCSNKFV